MVFCDVLFRLMIPKIPLITIDFLGLCVTIFLCVYFVFSTMALDHKTDEYELFTQPDEIELGGCDDDDEFGLTGEQKEDIVDFISAFESSTDVAELRSALDDIMAIYEQSPAYIERQNVWANLHTVLPADLLDPGTPVVGMSDEPAIFSKLIEAATIDDFDAIFAIVVRYHRLERTAEVISTLTSIIASLDNRSSFDAFEQIAQTCRDANVVAPIALRGLLAHGVKLGSKPKVITGIKEAFKVSDMDLIFVIAQGYIDRERATVLVRETTDLVVAGVENYPQVAAMLEESGFVSSEVLQKEHRRTLLNKRDEIVEALNGRDFDTAYSLLVGRIQTLEFDRAPKEEEPFTLEVDEEKIASRVDAFFRIRRRTIPEMRLFESISDEIEEALAADEKTQAQQNICEWLAYLEERSVPSHPTISAKMLDDFVQYSVDILMRDERAGKYDMQLSFAYQAALGIDLGDCDDRKSPEECARLRRLHDSWSDEYLELLAGSPEIQEQVRSVREQRMKAFYTLVIERLRNAVPQRYTDILEMMLLSVLEASPDFDRVFLASIEEDLFRGVDLFVEFNGDIFGVDAATGDKAGKAPQPCENMEKFLFNNSGVARRISIKVMQRDRDLMRHFMQAFFTAIKAHGINRIDVDAIQEDAKRDLVREDCRKAKLISAIQCGSFSVVDSKI